MTDRASRKRRSIKIPAESEGAPPAGHPGLSGPVSLRMEAEERAELAKALSAPQEPAKASDGPEPLDADDRALTAFQSAARATVAGGESAPYQRADGAWEVLQLDGDGRVCGRREATAAEVEGL